MRNFLYHLTAVFLGVLLLGGISSVAKASELHRMTKPPVSAQEYAARFQKALAVNAEGRSAVDGPNCGLTCATPEDVLNMLQRADPAANLTSVSELPAYIASLVVHNAPPGEWMMACKGGDGGVDAAPVWNCMSRAFHKDEKCLENPKTHRCVFAFDCGNVVGIQIEFADCLELHVGLKPGDEIHGGASSLPQGLCAPSILKTGADAHGSPLLDECPRVQCDFSGPSAFLRRHIGPWFSWRSQAAGDNVIRLPREFFNQGGVLVLCVIGPDGRQTLGRVINKGSFVDDKSYVLYPGWSLDTPWRGKPYEWHFADEAEPHLN